jgi:hypothetical protein
MERLIVPELAHAVGQLRRAARPPEHHHEVEGHGHRHRA